MMTAAILNTLICRIKYKKCKFDLKIILLIEIMLYAINFKLPSARRREALYFPAALGNITRTLKLYWYSPI
ncbi:hypothetical protein AFK69_02075 [Xenorhabdus sp. GDc328]|nr:hypothetical protein AAY47_05720 [Xenorhabdus griffiniae]KOP34892.1 hypothetical protein AFK69_02075 [Xenorhabdus sp. GDc328]